MISTKKIFSCACFLALVINVYALDLLAIQFDNLSNDKIKNDDLKTYLDLRNFADFALIENLKDSLEKTSIHIQSKELDQTMNDIVEYDNSSVIDHIFKGKVKIEPMVLFTLRGHASSISSAAFSSDGQKIVTAFWDGSVKVFDASDGNELLILKGHSALINSVSFSYDGKRIITASWDKTAKVFDAASGNELLTLNGDGYGVNFASFSHDGKRIVTALSDNTARVFNAVSGKELLTLKRHSWPVISASFSSNGKRIVTTSSNNIAKVFDVTNGKELLILKGHRDWLSGAFFSHNGKRIITASLDKTAKVWDALSGEELFTLIGHSDWVSLALFSRDGARIITASGDKTAKIWAMPPRELYDNKTLLKSKSAKYWLILKYHLTNCINALEQGQQPTFKDFREHEYHSKEFLAFLEERISKNKYLKTYLQAIFKDFHEQ